MKKVVFIVFIFIFIYLGTYISFRTKHVEIWEKNNKTYVIFPKNNSFLYYFYRPAVYIDGKLTGMSFHIGPHR